MEYYYKSMPENLTWTQKIEYTADVIVRDIGYVPILGLAVGILRIITGIAQKAISGEGSLYWAEDDVKVRFKGSKLSADGEANILRGVLECIPVIGLVVLPIWDSCEDDRYFLLPGFRIC